MTAPRTRSGRSRAYQIDQIPPPDAPTRTADSSYVYLEPSIPALLALARGRGDWSRAVRDGSVTAAGDPALVSRVGDWFRSVPERSHTR
ncbi:hypothetical protein [Rhodococcus sp. R1101]|uniref:hypothetical protein n=1 Tax=Rhodococcus sp. R1101 TaxID=1170698 RepID=UPI0002EF5519|nr:hypothetical protein [Rhodococcus sp. R1101]